MCGSFGLFLGFLGVLLKRFVWLFLWLEVVCWFEWMVVLSVFISVVWDFVLWIELKVFDLISVLIVEWLMRCIGMCL